MPRRLLLTLSTALTLFGVYAVYAMTVSPLFTPETIEQALVETRAAPPPAPESPNRQMAGKWLAGHDWTGDAKYQVRTSSAYIYAEDWQKVQPAGDVRFRPFALIYLNEKKPDREPLVVIADSALVKFTAPFDESNPKPGRVVAGALEGKVEIRGANGLAIQTRNVNFSEAALRVWSDEPIEFQYGINKGKGLGLELDLIPGPSTDDKPGVSGVRTLRIRRDVRLDLASKPKPGRKPEQLTITSVGNFEYQLEEKLATFRENVSVVHPGEKGLVDTLDCGELVVVFEEKKKAEPANPAVPAPPAGASPTDLDEGGDLDFRRLRGLADLAKGHPARLISQRAGVVAYCGEITYDRVLRVATLRDGHQVTVTQKNNELRCPEVTIVHEEKGGIVEALCRGAGRIESYATNPNTPGERGKLEFSGTWQTQLHKHPDAETGLDLIQFDGAAKLTQPGQLTLGGETIFVWATPDKSGSLKEGAAPEVAEKKDTDKAPSDKGADRTAQVKRVVAVKQVSFDGDRIRGQSERLEITVVEGKLPLAPPAQDASKPGRSVSATTIRRDDVVPFRTLEDEWRDSTRFVLPRAAGGTLAAATYDGLPARRQPDQARAGLEVHRTGRFDSTLQLTSGRRTVPRSSNKAAALMAVGDEPAAKPDTPQIRPAAGEQLAEEKSGVVGAAAITEGARPNLKPVPEAKGTAEKSPTENAPAEKAPAEPAHVSADLIQVTMVRDGKQMEASKVETRGNVVVKQPREGQPPLEVTGDWLELLNHSKTQQVVHVKGNPARIIDPRMDLEGADLHLNTSANTSRVEGAGTLRLPVTKGLDSKPLAKPEKLNVRWERQMEFDGLIARFYVGVEAVLGENKLTCHEMDVTLSRRVSFGEGAGSTGRPPATNGNSTKKGATGPAADVKTIHCKEGVEVYAYEHEPDGKLKSFRKGAMWDMTFDQRTGDTVALGPGTMTMWWKGDSAREGLASSAVVRANKGRQTERSEWNYAKIDFAESMTGNTKDKATLFRERVVVVYGPVKGTPETIDPDKLPNNSGWLRCGMLRLTQIAGATGKDHFEMVGTGNSELDGKTKNGMFHALADSVSFDESKGLYILRSEGNRKAKVWRQLSAGLEPQKQEGQRLEFNPETNSLKSDRTTAIDGIQ
jgi:hypothetical protein